MLGKIFLPWLAPLLALAALFAAVPASAGTGSLGEYGVRYDRCFADGTPGEAIAAPRQWSCGERTRSIAPERVYLRFDLAPGTVQPRFFETRRTALAGLDIVAVGTD